MYVKYSSRSWKRRNPIIKWSTQICLGLW